MTLHETFAASFDGGALRDRSTAEALALESLRAACPTFLQSGRVQGFGSNSVRFDNKILDSKRAKYGSSNGATIGLTETLPVPVEAMAASAPSNVLPDFAARFEAQPGRTFAITLSRDAPDGPEGEKRYFVQPNGGGEREGEVSMMPAPRGAGPLARMHETTDHGLMSPREQREVAVFHKCHERALKALRKGTSEACRRTLVMQRLYPVGVLGVESPSCSDTVVYAQQRERIQARASAQSQHAAARLRNLAKCRDSQVERPFLHHDIHDTAEARLFPRKGRPDVEAAGRCAKHYVVRPQSSVSSAFRSNQEVKLAAPRTARVENLVHLDAGGRTYDIISGARRPFQPTRQVGGEA